MRVLVTGGAGYVGSFATRALIDAGHRVHVLDDLSRGHRAAIPKDILSVGDVGDRGLVRDLLEHHGIEAVLHFAAASLLGESVHRPLEYYRNNVANTASLLAAMIEAGVGRLVFSSSCSVYSADAPMPLEETSPLAPQSPYAFSKYAVERMIEDVSFAHGLRFAVLRYFNAAGASEDGKLGEDHTPETHLIPLVLQVALGQRSHLDVFGDDYPTPDGTCIRDYVHVEDLAAAHVAALDQLQPERSAQGSMLGRVFNLGTGRGSSVLEVVAAAERVTKCAIPLVRTARRTGDSPRLVAAATRAMRELAWVPRYTDIDSVVASAWTWHMRHPCGYAKADSDNPS